MVFDFATLSVADRYKLLTATVVPRPIAWVVSQDPAGNRNAAPFSFFNALCDEPPIVGVSIGLLPDGSPKDSGANIRATGEFVVSLVPFSLMHAMHVTAIDFPPGVDELREAGLSVLPSTHVAPPRIAQSPAALECRTHSIVDLAPGRTLVLGQVLAMQVLDEAVLDAARCHIDTGRLDLVGRGPGAGGYVRATGPGSFTERRITLAEWRRG